MAEAPRADFERAVLKDAGWVQQIAQEMLRDPALAEDLSQDVLTAALASGGGANRSPNPRAWLRSVARNLALRRISREQERPHVERRAARAEAVETCEERLELQQHLTRAVGELDEIYRTVVVMRFFDGLSHAAIGERLGLQPAAVRKRLSRALAVLRVTLQRRLSLDDDEWRSAMARLACPLGPAGSTSRSSRAMPLALLAVGAFALVAWLRWPGAPAPLADIVLTASAGPTERLSEMRVDYIDAGGHGVATTDADGRVQLPGTATRVMIGGRHRAPVVFALGSEREQELSVDGDFAILGRLVVEGAPPPESVELKLAVSLADLQLGAMADLRPEWQETGEVVLRTPTIPDGGFRFSGVPADARMQLVLPDGLSVEFASEGEVLDGARGVYFDGFYGPVWISATTRED